MKKITSIIILIIIFGVSSMYSLAQEPGCCDDGNIVPPVLSPERKDSETLKIVKPDFKPTKAKVTYEKIAGVSVYKIEKNQDSYYNIGYALGKAIILNKPDYAKDLITYLAAYREVQSQYMLEKTLDSIDNALPCWFKYEMKGLTESLNVNTTETTVDYRDILLLNTVVHWTKIPKNPPKAPPVNPTSITPIKELKEHRRDLSPINSFTDQRSAVVNLGKYNLEEREPLVISSYSKYYKDFYDQNSAVMIYNMDYSSFISVGFNGLVTVLSGINNNGIVINTVQKREHEQVDVLGATDPAVISRMIMENGRNYENAVWILNTYNSNYDTTFILSGKEYGYIKKTSANQEYEVLYTGIIDSENRFIYNYDLDESYYRYYSKNFYDKLFTNTINFDYIMSQLRSKDMFDAYMNKSNDYVNTLFHAVYNLDNSYVLVLMPTGDILKDSKYIKVDFNGAKLYQQAVEEETDQWYDKYNEE